MYSSPKIKVYGVSVRERRRNRIATFKGFVWGALIGATLTGAALWFI